jgi:multiple sugar transport system permease protein
MTPSHETARPRGASGVLGRRVTVGSAAATGATVLLAVVFAIPLIWAVGSALKSPSEIHRVPPVWIPAAPQWQNLVEVGRTIPFYLFVRNSFVVALLGLVGALLSSTLVAYGFSHFRFRGRGFLFMLVLSVMMLPQEVTLIPTYLLYKQLGWLDTYLPLIVPLYVGGSAFSIFLLRQFFMTIPRDFSDAAKIDGCGHFRYYWQILLPLSVPVLITVAILNFQALWDDFLHPLIYLSSIEKLTVSVGLMSLNTKLAGEAKSGLPTEHLLMAGSLMAMVPTFVLFFVLQRYFIRGVIMSGIKG